MWESAAASRLLGLSVALAYQGELSAARAAADAGLDVAAELGEHFLGMGFSSLAVAALAAGDVEAAQHASQAAWQHLSVAQPHRAAAHRAFTGIEVALANGDLVVARRWADDAVAVATGWHMVVALTTRARVAIGEGEPQEA